MQGSKRDISGEKTRVGRGVKVENGSGRGGRISWMDAMLQFRLGLSLDQHVTPACTA